MPVEEQVVSIFAGVNGFLDNVPVPAVGRFEQSLLADLRANKPELLASIRDTRDLTDATRDGLKEAIGAFARTFA